MDQVYLAFKSLQKYMADKALFVKKDNHAEILQLLGRLVDRFHRVRELDSPYAKEIGFASTLHIIREMLIDVQQRFLVGKKDYAFWRLRNVYTYCVSCHTRYAVTVDFSDPDLRLENLSAFERGEFFLATRQFEKAQDAYLLAVEHAGSPLRRIAALRHWLVIFTRVQPNPRHAMDELNRLRARVHFTPNEQQEIAGWMASLERWKDETPVPIDPLRRAETLLSQGTTIGDEIFGKRSAVELLRATALLHELLDAAKPGELTAERRARILYNLGSAYSELSFFFADQLPEMFLEQCIRDYPGSDQAKRAFRLYREIVTLDYTGSAGTVLPREVKQKMDVLHTLAQGSDWQSPSAGPPPDPTARPPAQAPIAASR